MCTPLPILLDRKDLLVVAIIHDHNVIIFAYESRTKFIFAINFIIRCDDIMSVHAFVPFHLCARALSMWSRFTNVFMQIHLYPTRESFRVLLDFYLYTSFSMWYEEVRMDLCARQSH